MNPADGIWWLAGGLFLFFYFGLWVGLRVGRIDGRRQVTRELVEIGRRIGGEIVVTIKEGAPHDRYECTGGPACSSDHK